jgi:hypothetical protein
MASRGTPVEERQKYSKKERCAMIPELSSD